MLYAQMFGSPFRGRFQRVTKGQRSGRLPRFPAMEQAPVCTRSPSLASLSNFGQGCFEIRRTNYFTPSALLNHLLSGVFEA